MNRTCHSIVFGGVLFCILRVSKKLIVGLGGWGVGLAGLQTMSVAIRTFPLSWHPFLQEECEICNDDDDDDANAGCCVKLIALQCISNPGLGVSPG